jgi:FG-GAP-like repeat
MSTHHRFGTEVFLALVILDLGCGGTMNTGTAKKPANNKPAKDGTCPSADILCGTGVFAVCADLQSDPNHCGTCDQACAPGIACQAGVCQQTVCTGGTIPFSGQPTTSAATLSPGMPLYNANLILADINGDGRLDRIEWSTVGGICQGCPVDLSEFRVSLGLPDGSFAPPDSYHASDVISRVFTTDVNGDGLADLYVISWTYTASTNDQFHLELWFGEADGHLRRSDTVGLTVSSADTFGTEMAIGDLSGDGWPDLVIGAPTPDPNEAPPKINIYLSDSTGGLHLSQTFVTWGTHTFIGDWNGDGIPDLALLSGDLEILYNRGNGTFEQPLDCALSVGGYTVQEQDLLVKDFNRDGRLDIASEDLFKSRVGVMLGLGGCGFAPISYYDVPGSSEGFLRAADVNGDGILDIVSVGYVTGPDPNDPSATATVITDNLMGVLIGKPDGTFQLQDKVTSLGPNLVTDVTIGEITGDQRPDIVVSSMNGQQGQTSTWENTCQ